MRKDVTKDALVGLVGAEGVLIDEPMAAHTTFCIGGPADYYVIPQSVDQICKVIDTCRSLQVPLRIMGLGSDILVSDSGVRGVVLQIAKNLSDLRIEGEVMTVQAGCSNAEVAHAACCAGLAGYEFASGIPGTIGGAAIMNAGAYGGDFKGVAASLLCLTPEGDLEKVGAEDAEWSYRHSMMDAAGYVVLEATLRLRFDDAGAIQSRMDDLASKRAEKQPLEMPSAGSTFKRPEGYFAGKLVQDAGLRGYCVGGAQVSEKHTGFVVNAGGATATDVCKLIVDVQKRVYEQAGVQLMPEVRMWGFETE